MYRVGIEALLGVRRRGTALEIAPCIPPDWPGFELTYRVAATTFHIVVENRQHVSTGVQRMTLDGNLLASNRVPLAVDGAWHEVVVSMGPSQRLFSQDG
jgi:cellobiose phosphorylase